MGNQNPYIEEEPTTQWPNEKVQKDNQLSTKHTDKTKDRITIITFKTLFICILSVLTIVVLFTFMYITDCMKLYITK
jgi:hypothetical protein